MIIYQNQVTNGELEQKLDKNTTVILDVREIEEYAESHIPGSTLIPLGQLEKRFDELKKDEEIFVICHSGGRSNKACLLLKENGFEKVYNVIPGMVSWSGPVESDF